MILDNLDLTNFKLIPSQVYGSIRLISLVKESYDGKLKFNFEKYNALNIISVDKNITYTSYTPMRLMYHGVKIKYKIIKNLIHQKIILVLLFQKK